MKVALISESLAEEITGMQATQERVFNPVQLLTGQWAVSLLEAEELEPDQFKIIDLNTITNGTIL